MIRDHRPGGKAQHFFRSKWPIYLILGTGGGAFVGVIVIAVLNYSGVVTLPAWQRSGHFTPPPAPPAAQRAFSIRRSARGVDRRTIFDRSDRQQNLIASLRQRRRLGHAVGRVPGFWDRRHCCGRGKHDGQLASVPRWPRPAARPPLGRAEHAAAAAADDDAGPLIWRRARCAFPARDSVLRVVFFKQTRLGRCLKHVRLRSTSAVVV
jgi:hypothetical protein